MVAGCIFSSRRPGGKLWRWKYRFDGAEKLMALGRYPEVALADARERRDAARRRLANDIGPMAERMAEKTAVKVATEHTFEEIAEFWLEHWRGNKSARIAHSFSSRRERTHSATISWMPSPKGKE